MSPEYIIFPVWGICFVFAWGYAWKHMTEMHDSPELVALIFTMVAATAPVICIAVPFGHFAIWATKKVFKA